MTQGTFRALAIFIYLLTPVALVAVPEIRGIVLPIYAQDPQTRYDQFLEEIKDSGATHLSLTATWFLKDVNSVEISALEGRSPDLSLIETLVAQASERGLKVMLFPLLLLEDDGDGEYWRGGLEPKDVDQFFINYTEWMLELASFSERSGVWKLSIGSEFSSLEEHENHWRDLSRQVRLIYSGEISYTANWDTFYQITWWDAVDYLSISAYFELTDSSTAEVEELINGWQEWKDWLLEWAASIAPGKPILFTELGYPSREGAGAFPWDYTRKAPSDMEAQASSIEAFMKSWHGSKELNGVFFYAWTEFGREPLRDYSIRGKPAEKLIRDWFQNTSD